MMEIGGKKVKKIETPLPSIRKKVIEGMEIESGNVIGLNLSRPLGYQILAPATDTSVAANLGFFSIPATFDGWKITDVHAEVKTAGSPNITTIDINKNGTSVLPTKLTIDTGETGSDTAATPATIIEDGSEFVNSYDVITVDVDVIADTPAVGLFVTVTLTPPEVA